MLICDDNLLMAEVVAEFLRECGLSPMGLSAVWKAPLALERALDGAILDINFNGRPRFPICPIGAAALRVQ